MAESSPNLLPKKAVVSENPEGIKLMKLLIEYKHLSHAAPVGVYLLPAQGRLRDFHGTIFVRRGLYKDGIFKFVLNVTSDYNDVGSYPHIHFISPVFNPCVHSETNVLDLRLEYPEWNPKQHFLVNALVFLKKIFYLTSFDKYPDAPNTLALQLLAENKEEYIASIRRCVQQSVDGCYQQPEDFAFKFSEAQPAHRELLKRILRDVDSSLLATPMKTGDVEELDDTNNTCI